MTYPHRQRAPGILLCECGALAGTGPTSTWGADCRVAMRERIRELEAESDKRNAQLDAARERIAELEAERAAARTAALHEAAAEVRGLALEYIARTIRSGNYMSALTDAAARIEALTTTTNRSDNAR